MHAWDIFKNQSGKESELKIKKVSIFLTFPQRFLKHKIKYSNRFVNLKTVLNR